MIGSVFGIGPFFEQITDNVEVISFDCWHKGSLWASCNLIDIHLIFFYKQLDQIQVAIVAAPVESIDFGVSGEIGIEEFGLFGEEFFDFIDFVSVDVIAQILIVGIEVSDAL